MTSTANGRSTRYLRAAFFFALLVALASCGQLDLFGGGGEKPSIEEFSASPEQIGAGESVLLSWRVTGLEEGQLVLQALEDGSSGASQLGDVTNRSDLTVKPLRSTTYRLQASGPGGSSSRETSVSVLDGSGEKPPSNGEPGEEEQVPPEIASFASNPSQIRAGEAATVSWLVSDAQRVNLDPPGVDVGASGSMVVQPYVTTTYVLAASNGQGTTEARVTITVEGEDTGERILIVMAGQSNASGSGLENDGDFPGSSTEDPAEGVMMLTPEWTWVEASEPTHGGGEHSFGLRLGKEIRAATGNEVFLVPAAVSGSQLGKWQPGSDYFEDAKSQAEFAAENLGVPVSAVIWFQGESESKSTSSRSSFTSSTDNVLQGFREELPGNPGTIFVQLSKRLFHGEESDNKEGHNLAYQLIREQQRLMEAGSNEVDVGESNPADSSVDRSYYHMVVSHDLPMSDEKHVSAEGQRYLGRRIANTFLESVWSGSASVATGAGPRLERVVLSDGGRTILVDTSATINSSSSYDGYFSVFVDGNERSYSSIGRDSSDETRVRIEFSSPLSGDIEVRYMPPDDVPLFTWSNQAVHTTVGGLKLPLPAFGGPVEELPLDYFPGARMGEE